MEQSVTEVRPPAEVFPSIFLMTIVLPGLALLRAAFAVELNLFPEHLIGPTPGITISNEVTDALKSKLKLL